MKKNYPTLNQFQDNMINNPKVQKIKQQLYLSQVETNMAFQKYYKSDSPANGKEYWESILNESLVNRKE